MRLTGSATYLVVHIRNVHHEIYVEFEIVLHYAAQNIRAHVIARMSQVRVIVYGRSASIPGNPAPFGV